MYNQPTRKVPDGRGGFKTIGVLYKGPIDCLWKTASTEGIHGLYKGAFVRGPFRPLLVEQTYLPTGSTAHFIRIAPHTIITLMANEFIMNLYRTLRDGRTPAL